MSTLTLTPGNHAIAMKKAFFNKLGLEISLDAASEIYTNISKCPLFLNLIKSSETPVDFVKRLNTLPSTQINKITSTLLPNNLVPKAHPGGIGILLIIAVVYLFGRAFLPEYIQHAYDKIMGPEKDRGEDK